MYNGYGRLKSNQIFFSEGSKFKKKIIKLKSTTEFYLKNILE